jgi:acyl carrier protein
MSSLKYQPTLVVAPTHTTDDRHTKHALMADAAPANPTSSPEELELAKLIVVTLNLDVKAEEIDPNARLYREGLGLDSIDVLELALAISKKYGLNLRSDDENNLEIFSSLRSLSKHIQQHRSK